MTTTISNIYNQFNNRELKNINNITLSKLYKVSNEYGHRFLSIHNNNIYVQTPLLYMMYNYIVTDYNQFTCDLFLNKNKNLKQQKFIKFLNKIEDFVKKFGKKKDYEFQSCIYDDKIKTEYKKIRFYSDAPKLIHVYNNLFEKVELENLHKDMNIYIIFEIQKIWYRNKKFGLKLRACQILLDEVVLKKPLFTMYNYNNIQKNQNDPNDSILNELMKLKKCGVPIIAIHNKIDKEGYNIKYKEYFKELNIENKIENKLTTIHLKKQKSNNQDIISQPIISIGELMKARQKIFRNK